MCRRRDGHAAVTLGDGRIFVIGGYDGYSRLRFCEVYDPQTDVWSPIASMSTPRDGHAACALDGMIVVTGGYDGNTHLSSVEIYNPATNTWTTGPDMRTARYQHSCIAIPGPDSNTDVLVVTGGTNGVSAVKATEILSYKTLSSSSVPSATSSRSSSSSFSSLSQTFLSGLNASVRSVNGISSTTPTSTRQTVLLQGWSWTTGPDMSVARSGSAALLLPRSADTPLGVKAYWVMRQEQILEQKRLAQMYAED